MRPSRPNPNRNFKDPRYIAWRKAIRARDGNQCRKCQSKLMLQVHHIRRWADFPQLRFVVGNGITLCKKCHGLMWDNELMYAPLCMALLAKPLDG